MVIPKEIAEGDEVVVPDKRHGIDFTLKTILIPGIDKAVAPENFAGVGYVRCAVNGGADNRI
jgi:hypothetical protein